MLAGGVALAGTGFAIGSQQDDGSALAARDGDRGAETRSAHLGGGPGHHGLGSLADRLGVTEAKLREALDALRPRRDHDARRAELAAALAQSLGVDRAKVDEALEKLHAEHERRHDARRRRSGPRGPRGAGHRHGGRGGHHRGPGGPGGPLAGELAAALGVVAAEVREAHEAFHDAKRDEFAQQLADRLGIDVEKVEEALPPRP